MAIKGRKLGRLTEFHAALLEAYGPGARFRPEEFRAALMTAFDMVNRDTGFSYMASLEDLQLIKWDRGAGKRGEGCVTVVGASSEAPRPEVVGVLA